MTDQPPQQPSPPEDPADPESPQDGVPSDARPPGPRGSTRAVPEDDDSPRRRLTRGSDHKVLAGVCDGAGRYFDVDPVIFRVVLAVLSLTGGIGLIVYGTAWLVIPQEGERQSEAHRLLSGRVEGAPLIAVLMALVGCGLYASMLDNGANQAFSLLLLAATAGAVYWNQVRRGQLAGEAASSSVAATVVVDAPPAVQAPPSPGGSSSWWRDPLSKEPAYLWGPDDGPDDDKADRKAWRERKRAGRKEKSSWAFGLLVFLLVVTAGVVGTAVSWPYQLPNVSLEIGLISVLGVFGLAFVVASFAGRARGGMVFFSLLTLAGLITAASLPHERADWYTTWRPVSADTVQDQYHRHSGSGTLDLTSLALNGRFVSTRLEVRVGEARIRLPKDATVNITYHVGLGDVRLPGGKDHNGVNMRNAKDEKPLVFSPPAGTLNTGSINLDVMVGVGDLSVIR